MVRSLPLPHHRHINRTATEQPVPNQGVSHMSRAFVNRSAAAIISTALALSISAPAAAAAGTLSVPPTTGHSGFSDLGYLLTSRGTPGCNPFYPPLQICAAAFSYDVSNASNTPSAPPTAVPLVTHTSGFDWGDAAIGAAATMVLVGVGLGGIRAATGNHHRHAATS